MYTIDVGCIISKYFACDKRTEFIVSHVKYEILNIAPERFVVFVSGQIISLLNVASVFAEDIDILTGCNKHCLNGYRGSFRGVYLAGKSQMSHEFNSGNCDTRSVLELVCVYVLKCFPDASSGMSVISE